jgi:hypothetical protein
MYGSVPASALLSTRTACDWVVRSPKWGSICLANPKSKTLIPALTGDKKIGRLHVSMDDVS